MKRNSLKQMNFNKKSVLPRTTNHEPRITNHELFALLSILWVLSITLAAPAWSDVPLGDAPARKVISAWAEGTRGVIEIPAKIRLRVGQEFPVVRRDALIGIFTLYYIGDFNAWGVFSASDPELKLREGDTVVVFTGARKPRRGPAPAMWEGRVRYGIPAGAMVLAFVEGGMAEGIKPGDRGEAFLGDRYAGGYGVVTVGEHYSTGTLERIRSEELDYNEFIVKFEKK